TRKRPKTWGSGLFRRHAPTCDSPGSDGVGRPSSRITPSSKEVQVNGRGSAWVKRGGMFVAVAILGVAVGVAAEAATLKSAPVNHFDSADTTISVCTNTTTFVNIPDMTRTFSLGGSVNDEVVVMMQGTFVLNDSAAGSPSDGGVIELTVGGVALIGAPAIVYANRGGTHRLNFVTGALRPGNHTPRSEWRHDAGGGVRVAGR